MPFAIADSGVLNGILFAASRNLALLSSHGAYLEDAFRYNQQCIQSINKAIYKGGTLVSNSTITKVLLLAST
jgi:hypothetical protein